MTAVQICALIAIALTAGALYWIAYRDGFKSGCIDGYSKGYSEGHEDGGIVGFEEGMKEGKTRQHHENWEAMKKLEDSTYDARDQYKQLYAHYERALAASKLGEQERLTLLEIAEKLRIASETFSAFRTGKKLECDTRALRYQALAIAALLEPANQESAA
jgi:hypothetical protein